MNMFGYYAWHSFVNQLRKIFKTWVLIFIVVCMLVGGCIGLVAAKLTDVAEAQKEEQDVVEEIDEEPSWFEQQNIDPLDLTELAVGIVIIGTLTFLSLGAEKNGTKMFLPADVNLLFPSPMKPQSVLIFRLATKMGTAVFLCIYLMLQLPNLTLNLGLSLPSAIALLIDVALLFAFGNLLQVFLYLKCSTNYNLKQNLSRIIYCVLAVIAVSFFIFWKSGSMDVLPAAIAFFNAPMTRWIPIWGWFKAFPLWAAESHIGSSVISFLLILASCAGLFILIQHTESDFYEDAMAKSEETAAVLERAQAEQSGRVGMKKRKKDRSDKLKRDGMNKGFGSSVFFHKTIYNRFRFAHLGFFTKTMETYLVASIGAALFTRLILESDTILVLVLGLGVMAFYRALGNPLEQDVKMGYFLLIPESAKSKLMMSLLGSTVCCLLDLLPGMLIGAVILKANILQVLAWLPVILSVDLLSTIVGTFIDLSVPVNAGTMIKQFIQIFFIYFGLLPDIGILAVGIILNQTVIACIIATVFNILIGFLFFLLAAAYLEPNGGKHAIRQEEFHGDVKEAKKVFSKLGLCVVAMLAVATVFQLGISYGFIWFFPDLASSELFYWLVTFVPIYAIAFPVSVCLLKKIPSEPIVTKPLKKSKAFSGIFVCLFAMLVGNLIGTAITTLISSSTSITPVNGIESYATSNSIILKVIFLVILAPTIEEIIFRKMLIDRMHPYGAWLAVLSSAAMFGLFHGNLSQMFYAFLVGIVFGFVYLKTGKIQYTICYHIFINFLGGVIAPALLASLDTEAISNASSYIELASNPAYIYYLLYLVFMLGSGLIGFILLLVNIPHYGWKAQSKELPKGTRFSAGWCNFGMILFTLCCLCLVAVSLYA